MDNYEAAMIIKDNYEAAISAFHGTDVNITTEGKRQLGTALSTRSFVEEYVQQKVTVWVKEIERSPLIFSTSGGMGPIVTVVYRRLTSLIAESSSSSLIVAPCSGW